ncbi:J domain-containing protein [Anaerotruncus massiliensis (ex Liu et al. 2021)]|uniref:J domain-containing protein n=1 Tax=Anaerotruncus massiliensis (ex Liu et al. 2021) TaxID=2321404 RepID=UPI003AB66299
MAKQYAEPAAYEAKLEKVMARLGVEQYDYDWSRFECWVSFTYKGQPYRFSHSVANAKAHGVDIKYGSDVFAQVVLSLEDLARMVERGIYDLSTWVSGMKYLPAAVELPDCFRVLQFEVIPEDRQEVDRQFKRLAKVAHPDAGGTEQQFRVLQAAREQALGWFDGGMTDE